MISELDRIEELLDQLRRRVARQAELHTDAAGRDRSLERGVHENAAVLHQDAADLHLRAADLFEQHAAEVIAADPARAARALQSAHREREAAAQEWEKADFERAMAEVV